MHWRKKSSIQPQRSGRRSGTCECHSGWAGKACSDFIAGDHVPRLEFRKAQNSSGTVFLFVYVRLPSSELGWELKSLFSIRRYIFIQGPLSVAMLVY